MTETPKLSVCVITEMDAWSASTRYRALQHVPRLRSAFRRVDVSLPGDTLSRAPGRGGQIRYFAGHARRYGQRARTLSRTVAQYDSLLVQRGLYPLGPGPITRAIERYDGRLVLDLDDAVFELNPLLATKGRPARWLYGPQQTLALMRRADEIIVSTTALAEMLPSRTPAVTILPTVPDPDRHRIVEHRDERPVVVGWAGNVGGLPCLDPLAPIIERLSPDGLVRLEVVCSQAWGGPATFRRWRVEDETTLFDGFGIGVMPLPDTPYTRAKAGFKLLQYMASGLPVVASPVGVNRDLVNRSGAGFLAERPDEWESALRELAGSAELRRELGQRGRAFVERYADLDVQAQTLVRLLAGGRAT